MKKSYFYIFLSLFASFPIFAQKKLEQSFPVSSQKEIDLQLKYATQINLTTWDKNEVLIKASININDNAHNDNFELLANTEKEVLVLEGLINNLNEIATSKVIIQDNKNTYWIEGNYTWRNDGNVQVMSGKQIELEMIFEVFVPANLKTKVKTISGTLDLSGIQGELIAECVSGDIDIRIPENQKQDLKLKTITGDIYTNLNIEFPPNEKNKLTRIGGGEAKLSGKLNGGGTLLSLETISGNIYLRKK